MFSTYREGNDDGRITKRTGVAQRSERRSDWPKVAVFDSRPPYMFTHDILGMPECPYAERWLLDFKLFTIRVHHFMRSDDARAHHDHPWWFLTLVLRGGYTDRSPRGNDHLSRGSVRFRSAEHRHTVQVDPGGVWTLVLTGRKVRRWGFWIKGGTKFMKSNKYFASRGHHPCDQP